ncbi:MAG: DUF2752 domain-containing protein [Candidatus Omnitrophica bacterium]|nr:DUF2752 domain-containing protein [Candidatus Omnitrophota bacterium]
MPQDILLRFIPPCAFHAFTGLYCPGCGSARALNQLLHGNILLAIRFNPLTVMFLLGFSGYSLFYTAARLKKRNFASEFIRPVWVWALLVVILLFWILRNIPFYPFTLLAPH